MVEETFTGAIVTGEMPRTSRQPRLPGFDFDEDPSPEPAHPATTVLFESPADVFRRVFRDVRPRTAMPMVTVEYCRFANANSFIRMDNGKMEIRISDVLQGVPSPILESLAYILVCKLYRRPVPAAHRYRYRSYLNRQDMRRSLHLLRQARGRKHISGPQGENYDLARMFAELNARFFNGLMAQPALGWSRNVSRTLLGHFDPAHNAIVLSRLLDQPHVPLLAVEYVLYHEMLHLRHPVETSGAKRRVHTPAFKAEEKLFPGYKEAKALLEKICSARLPSSW